jgi:hypothetical protein
LLTSIFCPTAVAKEPPPPPNYFNNQLKQALVYTSGLGGLSMLGVGSPNAAFTAMSTTFGLRNRFYKTPFWPETFRINFHT